MFAVKNALSLKRHKTKQFNRGFQRLLLFVEKINQLQAKSFTNSNTHTHTRMHTHMRTHTHTRTHTHMRTHTRTRTHTHTCAHTQVNHNLDTGEPQSRQSHAQEGKNSLSPNIDNRFPTVNPGSVRSATNRGLLLQTAAHCFTWAGLQLGIQTMHAPQHFPRTRPCRRQK